MFLKVACVISGLFEASHMNYEYFRVAAHDPAQEEAGEPSLAEMTVKALRILQKEPRGYFLFVEGKSRSLGFIVLKKIIF